MARFHIPQLAECTANEHFPRVSFTFTAHSLPFRLQLEQGIPSHRAIKKQLQRTESRYREPSLLRISTPSNQLIWVLRLRDRTITVRCIDITDLACTQDATWLRNHHLPTHLRWFEVLRLAERNHPESRKLTSYLDLSLVRVTRVIRKETVNCLEFAKPFRI
jgi:hypothetical protein